MTARPPDGIELVRRFVNTLELETGRDEIGTAAALSRWLAAERLLPEGTRLTGADLRRARGVREGLRAVLAAHNGVSLHPSDTSVLEDALRSVRVGFVARPDGTVATRAEGRGVDRALGPLLAAVVVAQADGSWPRLKACREPACRWAFVDRSRNRSGAWCDMAVCGNRSKARAFRARRQGA